LGISSTVLLLAAIVIVAVLAAIAGYYLWQLRLLSKKRKDQKKALEQAGREQRDRVNKSIQIIAQAIIEDQMTLTEGAIRVRVLLDGLGVDESVQEEFAAFYQLAKATEHIPILAAWKELSTKKKLAFDSERERLERDYREFVLDAATRIQGQVF